VDKGTKGTIFKTAESFEDADCMDEHSLDEKSNLSQLFNEAAHPQTSCKHHQRKNAGARLMLLRFLISF
jgi:hypothetical protein